MAVSFLTDMLLFERLADFSSICCPRSIDMAGWCMTAQHHCGDVCAYTVVLHQFHHNPVAEIVCHGGG